MEKLLIKYIEVRLIEDSYKHGENPDSATSYSLDHLTGKTFANLSELSKLLDIECTKENTISFDNRVMLQDLTDINECQLSAAEMEQWKKGKFQAYARSIDIGVTIIIEQEATEEETSKLLNISAYG